MFGSGAACFSTATQARPDTRTLPAQTYDKLLPTTSGFVVPLTNCPVLLQLAIYSPADRLQPHRYKADESYEISGPEMTPVQSYLDVEAIIALAKQQSVDAIHPGYGFLSENTTFARRCGEEGIVFIGPTAKTIEVSLRLFLNS